MQAGFVVSQATEDGVSEMGKGFDIKSWNQVPMPVTVLAGHAPLARLSLEALQQIILYIEVTSKIHGFFEEITCYKIARGLAMELLYSRSNQCVAAAILPSMVEKQEKQQAGCPGRAIVLPVTELKDRY
jgi:hypothetical protein